MPKAKRKDGKWCNARPLPYYSLVYRLQMAWDVITYKADALYWEVEDKIKSH